MAFSRLSSLTLPVSLTHTDVLYILIDSLCLLSFHVTSFSVPFFLTNISEFLDAFLPFGDGLHRFIYLSHLEGGDTTQSENSFWSQLSSFLLWILEGEFKSSGSMASILC